MSADEDEAVNHPAQCIEWKGALDFLPTHCPRGHENTWTDGKRRNCRACARENQRRYRNG